MNLPLHSTWFTRSAILLIFGIGMAGCKPALASPEVLPSNLPEFSTPSPAAPARMPVGSTLAPVAASVESTLTLTPKPTQLPFEVCSPLEDVALSEMDEILSNPFQPPRPGMDDGHHGADFAYYTRGDHDTMLGLPVHALLAGIVAAVVENRPPYGYAVMIETPLDALPDRLLDAISPTPQPTPDPANIRLTCPTPENPLVVDGEQKSVYVLYAHLNQRPSVEVGDAVTCGQVIGAVGTTGASVNPHLHLETRWGPAGAVFPSMAHYEIQATDEERAGYCAWRVSGMFQMIDPMTFIQ